MASTVLHSLNLAPAQPSSVAEAMHDLALACGRLAQALWATLRLRLSVVAPALTAFEEAEQVRAFAYAQQQFDPRFADDLYAAADRHERKARD